MPILREYQLVLSHNMFLTVIEKQVSEKLDSISHQLGELTEGMDEEDVKIAKLMILDMVRDACNEHCDKMKIKIESGVADER